MGEGVRKLMILIRETLEEFLRNFFGEEMGGVRGTPAPEFKKSIEKIRRALRGAEKLRGPRSLT